MGVEVKHGNDVLRDAQTVMHVALLSAGIKVEVVKSGKKRRKATKAR